MDAIADTGATAEGLPEAPPFFTWADGDYATNALSAAGFSAIKTWQITINWPVVSAEFYVEKFKRGGARVGEILRRQATATYDDIVAHVRERLRRYPANASGGVIVPTPIFIASGVK